ncbi:hypothetical protein AAC387_Pa03g2456 [Persea americana]
MGDRDESVAVIQPFDLIASLHIDHVPKTTLGSYHLDHGWIMPQRNKSDGKILIAPHVFLNHLFMGHGTNGFRSWSIKAGSITRSLVQKFINPRGTLGPSTVQFLFDFYLSGHEIYYLHSLSCCMGAIIMHLDFEGPLRRIDALLGFL